MDVSGPLAVPIGYCVVGQSGEGLGESIPMAEGMATSAVVYLFNYAALHRVLHICSGMDAYTRAKALSARVIAMNVAVWLPSVFSLGQDSEMSHRTRSRWTIALVAGSLLGTRVFAITRRK